MAEAALKEKKAAEDEIKQTVEEREIEKKFIQKQLWK